MQPTFRFAPSPNGMLHMGHAYSALLNHDLARAAGGRFLLRIENIDFGRCRPEYEAAIHDDLRWLGLRWEEPVWRQSERSDAYRAALERLAALGLLYPCFATRAEIVEAVRTRPDHAIDPDGAPVYPGFWRNAGPAEADARTARGDAYALRLDMARAVVLAREKADRAIAFTEIDEAGEWRRIAADPSPYGDVVIARKEFPASYHLAVVVDDAAQGVTHVVRGRDLARQTAIHRLLQILLDLPEPVYRHHRLILGSDGEKLAKSRKDESLAALRASGATPDEVRLLVGLQEEQL